MNQSTPIRVLLVDDHAVVLEGLVMVLSRFDDLELVGTASGGAEGVALAAELQPDVVLLDLSMPDVDGAEATRRIRADQPQSKVLALTAFLEHRLVTEVIEAGATGYLLKSASGNELAEAIRTVASGGTILATGVLSLLATPPDTIGHDLTPRELDVLDHLANGLSNKHIAAELGLSSGTVRIHVSNVLAKLQVENRTAAAMLARDHRLVTSDLDVGTAPNV
jgi:NarL family two-component system response regulator LiaR